jgi:RNA polymerase sigma-70 factor (ECF subfamily)
LSSTNQNTKQLLKLCCAGNQRAQLAIYNRYYKAMYNTAYRIVKDSYKAEDVMQESFLTAFSKLNELNNIDFFSAWLKRIVINNSISDYSKTLKNNEIGLDTVLYKMEDENTSEGLETADLNNLKVQQIITQIETLKPSYNIGLTLHLIEGYDYEEIAALMNINTANCRTLISRAKESLRRKLSENALF